MGVNVGGFVAGGILSGLGQGIQKEAEDARNEALMAFKLQTEIGLKQMEVEGNLKGHEISAKGRTDAAGITATAAQADTAARVAGEQSAAKIHADATVKAANIHETGENTREAGKVDIKPNGTTGTYWGISKDGKTTFDTHVAVGEKNPDIVTLQDGTLAAASKDASGKTVATPITDSVSGKPVKGTKVGDLLGQLVQQMAGANAGGDTAPTTPAPGILPDAPPGSSSTPPPAAGSPTAPANASPVPTPSYKPGQTVYIRGVPHIVQPDGKTALPATSSAPAPVSPQVPIGQ